MPRNKTTNSEKYINDLQAQNEEKKRKSEERQKKKDDMEQKTKEKQLLNLERKKLSEQLNKDKAENKVVVSEKSIKLKQSRTEFTELSNAYKLKKKEFDQFKKDNKHDKTMKDNIKLKEAELNEQKKILDDKKSTFKSEKGEISNARQSFRQAISNEKQTLIDKSIEVKNKIKESNEHNSIIKKQLLEEKNIDAQKIKVQILVNKYEHLTSHITNKIILLNKHLKVNAKLVNIVERKQYASWTNIINDTSIVNSVTENNITLVESNDRVRLYVDKDTKIVKSKLLEVLLKVRTPIDNMKIVSCDPGLRTFLSIYDPINNKHVELFPNLINYIENNKDIDGELIRNHVHQFSIKYLCENYDTIIIPRLELKCWMGERLNDIKALINHDIFIDRLEAASRNYPNCKIIKCYEKWTSKACSKCGHIDYYLKISSVYSCSDCGYVIDRDHNASRNILLKFISKVPQYKISGYNYELKEDSSFNIDADYSLDYRVELDKVEEVEYEIDEDRRAVNDMGFSSRDGEPKEKPKYERIHLIINNELFAPITSNETTDNEIKHTIAILETGMDERQKYCAELNDKKLDSLVSECLHYRKVFEAYEKLATSMFALTNELNLKIELQSHAVNFIKLSIKNVVEIIELVKKNNNKLREQIEILKNGKGEAKELTQ